MVAVELLSGACMILLLNGAFGVGKTTVARLLVARLPRAVLFDPELIGIALQRGARMFGRRVDDFQDLVLWRRLTVLALRVTRTFWPRIVVPMTFSNSAYLDEIRAGISRFEPRLFHVCLVAPIEVIRERLARRDVKAADTAWQFRRAAECCNVHDRPEFAVQIGAFNRSPDEIAAELFEGASAWQ
jgi:predicted kinase